MSESPFAPELIADAKLSSTAVAIEFHDGTRARVCSLGDLRAMKLASGRPRDLVDVAELDELHGAS